MNPLLKDLLAAGRIANLPTVWTNLLCGAVCALHFMESPVEKILSLNLFWGLFSGTSLYLSGCLYNDYYDREWDAKHKPDRAVPTGRLSPILLLTLAVSLGILGLGSALMLGLFASIVAAGILFFIWVYTLIHKKTVFGILPMGLCRAGLYFLGLAIVFDGNQAVLPLLVIPALGLLFYIAGITLIARSEATNLLPTWAKRIGMILLVSPLVTHPYFEPFSPSLIIALLAFIGTLVIAFQKLQKKQVGSFVSQALASICLVDTLLISTLPASTWPFALLSVCLSCFFLAKWLQKVAPAT